MVLSLEFAATRAMPAARRLFFGTILYLPLLWIVLLADHFTHRRVIDYTHAAGRQRVAERDRRRCCSPRLDVHPPRARLRRHRACMLAAFATSALFLTSYLVYHAKVGSVPLPGQGVAADDLLRRSCITHVMLAAAILPLALMTLSRALARRFDRHRRDRALDAADLAVCVGDGVVIYVMLYQLTGLAGRAACGRGTVRQRRGLRSARFSLRGIGRRAFRRASRAFGLAERANRSATGAANLERVRRPTYSRYFARSCRQRASAAAQSGGDARRILAGLDALQRLPRAEQAIGVLHLVAIAVQLPQRARRSRGRGAPAAAPRDW